MPTIKGLMIKDGKCSKIFAGEGFSETLGIDDMISPALWVNGEYFGCACSKRVFGLNRDLIDKDTTVILKDRYCPSYRIPCCWPLVKGPCIIYRNAGLEKEEVEFLYKNMEKRNGKVSIICHHEGHTYEYWDP